MMKAKIMTLVVGIVFSSMTVQANNTQSNLPLLTAGVSDTQALVAGQVKRYQLDIEHPTSLKIVSRHFAGSSSQNNMISATLRGPDGSVVATAMDANGHFVLQRSVVAGRYQLEVTGASSNGAADESTNKYSLEVTFN
ncbi:MULTISPECIES: hypothetical protein [Cobetia]|uniref:Carboxypeptidase regulatory-like domain-containing protein n=1 Tax=Cobetia crustatorum TaxID=553385 RepID=A0A558HEF1_9GAMM|nr:MULTISPECIES: hypothetical protein [Cobetia]TVU67509.1 hypothetical protein FQP86_16715 [Cobetia crustatorum]